MHRSFWGDLATELKGLFARWPIAVVGLTVLPSVAGAIFVPSEGAAIEERLLIAAVAAGTALLCLSMVAIVVALIRVPVRDYRQRHLQAKLGQECIDCARQIVGAIGQASSNPRDESKAVKVQFFRAEYDENVTRFIESIKDLDEVQVRAFCFRYETECAPRVYRCATELYEREHISQSEREKLRNSTPTKHHSEGLAAALVVLESVQMLIHIGVRLGGRAVDT
jgi:hypothetical protein